MSENLPAIVPSLARIFEPERKTLQKTLTPELSAAQVVGEARRALDRVGVAFTHEVSDPNLQKSGLWLLEMVKAGAGILDRATGAEVVWSEQAAKPKRQWAGRGLFYGASGMFAVAGLLQGSMLTIFAAAALAGLRFFDPKDWGHILDKIPFRKKTIAIEAPSGRRMAAEAFIRADAYGFITQLVDALKTADHILLRLAEPQIEADWRDNSRLIGMMQSLLEAENAGDGDFALTLIKQEMTSVLAGEEIDLITYSKKNKDMFDVLPAIGETETKMAAPALVANGKILRRGTVWKAEGAS
jgi:hypothetical protein